MPQTHVFRRHPSLQAFRNEYFIRGGRILSHVIEEANYKRKETVNHDSTYRVTHRQLAKMRSLVEKHKLTEESETYKVLGLDVVQIEG